MHTQNCQHQPVKYLLLASSNFFSCYCQKYLFKIIIKKKKQCRDFSDFQSLMPPSSRFGWTSVLASIAHMQAHQSLGVWAGTCGDTREAHFQLPLSAAEPSETQGIRLPFKPSPGTGVGAGPKSKAMKLLRKLTSTTEQFHLIEIIYCISYLAFIFFLPFKHTGMKEVSNPQVFCPSLQAGL